jgi:hypothetical protein
MNKNLLIGAIVVLVLLGVGYVVTQNQIFATGTSFRESYDHECRGTIQPASGDTASTEIHFDTSR